MSRSRRRDNNFYISRSSLPLAYRPDFISLSPMLLFEDRRQWNPEGYRAPARSVYQSRHRLTANNMSPLMRRSLRAASPHVPWGIRVGFQNPRRVLICVRRRIRREVMHALRFTGRGGGKQRPPRRSEYSNVHC